MRLSAQHKGNPLAPVLKTHASYSHHMKEFLEATKERFLEDVDGGCLRRYVKYLADEGYSSRTQTYEVERITQGAAAGFSL